LPEADLAISTISETLQIRLLDDSRSPGNSWIFYSAGMSFEGCHKLAMDLSGSLRRSIGYCRRTAGYQ